MGPAPSIRNRRGAPALFLVLFVALLVALAAAPASAQPAPVRQIGPGVESVDLMVAGWRMEDPTGQLRVEDVADAFARGELTRVTSPSSRVFGVDKDRAIWFRFDVSAASAADWMLEVTRPELHRVRLFVRPGAGDWQDMGEIGDQLPYSARPLPHRSLVFPFHLPAGASALQLRVKVEGPGEVRTTLWEPAAMRERDASFNNFAWMYYGTLGGMLLYNLLLYIMVRDRGYLYYVGAIIGSVLGFMGQTGLATQYLGDGALWWSGRFLAFAWLVTSLFRVLLTRHFLSTPQRAPVIDKSLAALVVACIASAVATAMLPRYIAGPMMIATTVGSSLFIDAVAIIAVVRRWPGAPYFLASWVVLSIGVAASASRFIGLLPTNVVTTNLLPSSAAISYILLSIALAHQINEEKRQKEQAQGHMLAIMRASQALGAESRLDRLHASLRQIMAVLTGATHVHLVLWDPDNKEWFLQEGDASKRIALADVGPQEMLPVSLVQHVANLQEPLMIPDVAADARFASDPAFAQARHASLLALPIDQHGAERAVLVLENRSGGRAFSASDIETLASIAGPLAVSVENVLLYERLEQRVAEQTRELRETQQQLVTMARRAGMAEIATNVLHNMGNILNSVNVEADLLRSRLHESKLGGVTRAAALLEENAGNAQFLQSDKGRLLPGYLRELGTALVGERDDMLERLARLLASVDHIKNVVATQQAFAGSSVFIEKLRPREIVDEALRISGDSLVRHNIFVVKELDDIPLLLLDKTRALQILVNLISNARQAMQGVTGRQRTLRVRMRAQGELLVFEVSDEGCGIAPENLSRIFSHGFTTRSDGHGFGLHSSALAAGEMGGRLTAESEGPGHGATFRLELPLQPA